MKFGVGVLLTDEIWLGIKMPPISLSDLVAPIGLDQFMTRYWGREHVVLDTPAADLGELFPWRVLNKVLSEHRLEAPRLRLAKEGACIPESSYTRANLRGGLALFRVAEIMNLLRDGATLVLDGADELHPPLRKLVSGLEAELGDAIWGNLYASWGLTKGFDLHWDSHDVFVLQLHGRKKWQVYGFSRPAPVHSERGLKFPPPEQPLWEGTLEPGQILYMPRGCWHVATALAEPTLHVTIGISRATGIDYIEWITKRLSNFEIARKDLPSWHNASEARKAVVDGLVAALAQSVTADSMCQFLQERTRSIVRERPTFNLPWQATPQSIPPGIDFTVGLAGFHPVCVERTNEALVYRKGSMKYQLPLQSDVIIELLRCGPRSFPTILREAPGLTEDRVRGILGELCRTGIAYTESSAA